jgi:hypothetical protein
MTLAFEATIIDCVDALGGDILQVSFDTMPEDQDEDQRSTPYVLISRNFEFAESAILEWHDGNDYDGGAKIRSITLTRTHITLFLHRELTITVTFQLTDEAYTRLTVFLSRIMDNCINVIEYPPRMGLRLPIISE